MRKPDIESGQLNGAELLAAVEQRIRAGERDVASSLLRSENWDSDDLEIAIDVIYREYIVLQELGGIADEFEYCERFPQHSARLRRLIELDDLLDDETEPVGCRSGTIGSKTSDKILEELTPGAGRIIAGYQLMHEIGHGGSSRVYKARQVGLDRYVAVKLLAINAMDARFEKRFKLEAELVARLQHSNIVQVFDFGCEDGQFYLVMELSELGSLEEQPQFKWSFDEIALNMIKLARAVQYAHEQKVLHRDLKPSNILLTHNGEPKIADFGLAKKLESEGYTRVTETGTTIGTPSYMAPEQIEGKPDDFGPEIDVYGLGGVLYQLITGRAPFVAESAITTLRLLQDSDPIAPSKLRTKLPRDLEVICLRCLNKEPKKRFESAEELARELQRFVDQIPIISRPANQIETTWRWCRRRPLAACLIAALFVTFVFGFAGISWQWRQSQLHADNAEEKHRLAAANYKDARKAIDRLTRINIELADTPGTDSTRRKALTEVLSFYLNHVDELDDTDVAHEAARTYLSIAKISQDNNELDNAIDDLRRSLEILEALHAVHPNKKEYGITLADGYFRLGTCLIQNGQMQESADAHLQAAKLFAANAKDERSANRLNALSQVNAAGSYFNLGEIEIANKLVDDGLALFEKFADDDDLSWRYQTDHALGIELKAKLLQKEGKLPEAILMLKTAGGMWEGATDGGKKHRSNIDYIARICDALGHLQFQLDPADLSWKTNRMRANELYGMRWKRRPDRPVHGSFYAIHSRNLAKQFWLLGDQENAKPFYRSAIDTWRDINQRFPFESDGETQDVLAYRLCCFLAFCPCKELRDVDTAIELCRRELSEHPESHLALEMAIYVESVHGDIETADELRKLHNRLFPEIVRPKAIVELERIVMSVRREETISEHDKTFLQQIRTDQTKDFAGIAMYFANIVIELIGSD